MISAWRIGLPFDASRTICRSTLMYRPSVRVKKQPNRVGFLVNEANNHMFLGRLDEAEAVLRKILKSQAGNPQANWLLSNVHKAADRDHVEELGRLVKQENRNPRALAFLNYGLGKELEDLEDWDNAFEAFASGAKSRRSTIECIPVH